MRFAHLPHAQKLFDLKSALALPSHQLLERAGLVGFVDAGFAWWSPLGQRIMMLLQQTVRSHLEARGFLEVAGPLIASVSTLEKGGWLAQFEDELMRLGSPTAEFAVPPTSEEPLLAYLASCGSLSHRQLPLQVFEFRPIFRFRRRTEGLYQNREFGCCLIATFDEGHDDFLRSSREVKNTLVSLWESLHLDVHVVTHDETGTFEALFDYERGDRRLADTVVAKRGEDFQAGDLANRKWGGLAMGYRYDAVAQLGLQVADRENALSAPFMGTFGMGMQRLLIAMVEQGRTPSGIVLPKEIRPFDCVVIHAGPLGERETSLAEDIYKQLQKAGAKVAWDDRPRATMAQRMEVADFFGIPLRLVVGPSETDYDQVQVRFAHGQRPVTLVVREESWIARVEEFIREESDSLRAPR